MENTGHGAGSSMARAAELSDADSPTAHFDYGDGNMPAQNSPEHKNKKFNSPTKTGSKSGPNKIKHNTFVI